MSAIYVCSLSKNEKSNSFIVFQHLLCLKIIMLGSFVRQELGK